MSKMENETSRLNRTKKKKRSDRFLNVSILIVVILIVITASFVFRDGSKEDKADENQTEATQEKEDAVKVDDQKDDEEPTESDELKVDENKDKSKVDASEEDEESQDEAEIPGTLTHFPSDDSVVVETIVDTSWEPITTKQTGEHVSSYEQNSVDLNEKKEAFSYATGIETDSLIFWKINNGGSADKSVAVVSTHDKSEKYRIYIEWIDQQGWKPVKVDVLKTLDL